jgi:hypothetical protein
VEEAAKETEKEMTRSEEYIQLFEGFKLGSLGVSRKPVVTIEPEEKKPEPVPELKILKEEETSVRVDRVTKRLPSIYWADVDGYRYHLKLDYRPEHKSFLFVLVCGIGIATGGMRTLWLAYSKMMPDHDDMLHRFDFYVSGIKAEGLESIDLKEFSVSSSYTSKYQKWIKERVNNWEKQLKV